MSLYCSLLLENKMIEIIVRLLVTFILTILVIKFFKPLASTLGLLDKPGGRKQHETSTPLIGGLALYVVVVIASIAWGRLADELYYYLAGAGIMVVTGALDDRFHLGVRIRIVLEVIAACFMMFGAGVVLNDLGNLFGLGNVVLPMAFAVPFTIIATLGTINCLNMIDGLDGLAAGLTLQSIITYTILIGGSGSTLFPIITLIAGLMAFLVFNLQLYPGLKKVFLGDAGSMLLGFTIVWLLARNTQIAPPGTKVFEPATALFVLGLPLFDMVATVFRRAAKGKNPFKPDRTHAHHILLHSGMSHRQGLVTLLVVQLLINTIGIILSVFEVQSYFQLMVFVVMFFVYFKTIQHAFKSSRLIQKMIGSRRDRKLSKVIIVNDASVENKKIEEDELM